MAGGVLARKRAGAGGGWEYHYSLFPTMAQAKLVADNKPAEPESHKQIKIELGRDAAWEFFDQATDKRKDDARNKLEILQSVDLLTRGGFTKDLAVYQIAQEVGKSKSTIYNWIKMVAGKDRSDWLPYLIPHHAGRPRDTDCHPDAWDMLTSDYLRHERPTFQSCYRNIQRAGKEHGWTMPSERSLQRRMDREISHPVQVLARYGMDRLKHMYPAQERDRSVFHALEAVNADGHTWDVWVEWPDGEVLRPCMVAWQDLYSGMFLSWRLDKSENQESIRLSFGDLVEDFGIPGNVYLDNGRGFASKWMTGGSKTRFRFKIKDDEPVGILTSLDINIHWTTPYHGQAKPIERAFRGFCNDISKHPALAGAWSGNNPLNKPENYRSRAIKLDDFLAIVADGIEEHNSRAGRRATVCKGRSFIDTFRESYEKSPIKKATDEQRRLWLLAAEGKQASRRDGSISLMKNRYWANFLHNHMGEKLVCRFDPQNLLSGLHVYRLDGSYLGFAEVIEATGFNDVNAAREHGLARRHFMKAIKLQLVAERKLNPGQVADLIPAMGEAPDMDAKIVRMVAADPSLMRHQPEPDTPLSDADQIVHDEVVADISAYLPQKAETDVDRFIRAKELEEIICNKGFVEAKDRTWLTGYQTTPEYKSQEMMAEDFGTPVAG